MSNCSYHLLNFWHPGLVALFSRSCFPDWIMCSLISTCVAGEIKPSSPSQTPGSSLTCSAINGASSPGWEQKVTSFPHAPEHMQSLSLRSLVSCSPQSASKDCPLSVELVVWPYFSLPTQVKIKCLGRRKADFPQTVCSDRWTGRCLLPLGTSPLLPPWL